ncbi:TPR repeat protein [Candidatus Koribacter versatilis Ellin345]|uniref:TPR repeat protein n=1 Tax=Koribacter versatilis (strain Ellin345) TaxID=204669 RepID=Q1IPF7_KORVE|nr:hypothetical protein [Candidatus Koribacter versatilis]ABF41243.1 TPR repeat protein [Candidatus Koribacter versatilis Ellin345]
MKRIATLSICAALALGSAAVAQEDVHKHHHDDGVDHTTNFGHVNFQTSCSPAAQTQFETGVAALHSFEYTSAKKLFGAAEQADSECAIAYWGEAMTLWHQLWDTPKQDVLNEGWAMIQKGEKAKHTSARESGYLKAVEAYYKPSKQTPDERATAYSDSMGKLHDKYPDDEEAAVFYALSLLASEPPTDTTLANPKKAVAILNQVLAKDPDHPGVTHYIIHASDNPHMAQDAVAAAKKYASIAPGSPHAVHMPSHIFARVGYWQDSINSNLAAIAIAKKGNEVDYQLHPMDFLMYAYLQTGQDDKARTTEQEAVGMENKGYGRGREPFYYYVQAHFPSMLALELRDWKAAEALQPVEGGEPGFKAITYWAQAVGAGHLKDVAKAQEAVKNVDAAIEAENKAHPEYSHAPVNTDKNEAHAWLAYAQGNNDEAFRLLKEVIDYQDKVGKGEVELPAREMYADMLLELNRPADALEQYKISLKTDPNRFNGVYGAGKAAEMAGQHEVAVGYYKQLAENCKEAAPVRSELAHAREVAGGATVAAGQ